MPIIIGTILAIIAGVIIGFVSPVLLIAYIGGMTSGVALTLSLTRKLGKKSQRSLLASELFYKLTRYKAPHYHIQRTPHNITVKAYGDDSSKNLTDILKNQLGFPTDRVKLAIKHTMEIAPDKPLEDKITEALKFLDTENNYTNTTKEA